MPSSTFPPELWPHLSAMAPGRTYGAFFDALADPKSPPGLLGHILDANPGYLHLIQEFEEFQARRKRWEADAPPEKSDKEKSGPKHAVVNGEALVTTLGKSSLRDIIATIRFHRAAGFGLPRRPGDRFSPSARDTVKHALTAESFCEDHRMANPEFAYAGGLLYDGFMFRFAQTRGAPKEAKAQLEGAWKEGFVTGQLAYGLAGQVGQLKLSPYAFGAGLAIPFGRAWMAWFYPQPVGESPSWKEFQAECETHGAQRRVFATLTEKKRFGITHSELSALFAAASGGLAPVESAIACYAEPELIKQAAPSAYDFARVLKAASILSSAGLSGAWDGARARCTAHEVDFIRSLKIPDSSIQLIMKKARPA